MFNYTKEMIEKAIKEAPVEVINHGETPDVYKEFNGITSASILDNWLVNGAYILFVNKLLGPSLVNKVIIKRYNGFSKFILEKVFRTKSESILPHELLHYVQYNNFSIVSEYKDWTEEDIKKLPFGEQVVVREEINRVWSEFKLCTEIDAYAFDLVREKAGKFRINGAAHFLAKNKIYQFGKIMPVSAIKQGILERMEYFKENFDMFKPLIDYKIPE